MRNKGYLAAAVLIAALVCLGIWIFSIFSPYDICVSYYAKKAAPSMGSGAMTYAENLCDKKIRFWK
jgi:hypothetical protein